MAYGYMAKSGTLAFERIVDIDVVGHDPREIWLVSFDAGDPVQHERMRELAETVGGCAMDIVYRRDVMKGSPTVGRVFEPSNIVWAAKIIDGWELAREWADAPWLLHAKDEIARMSALVYDLARGNRISLEQFMHDCP